MSMPRNLSQNRSEHEISGRPVARLRFDDFDLEYKLRLGKYIVGKYSKDVKTDIVLADESVDVKHSLLEVAKYKSLLVDCFSRNGTFVDNIRLEHLEVACLPASSFLRFGNVNCTYNSLQDDRDFIELPASPNDTQIKKIQCDSVVFAENFPKAGSSFSVPATQNLNEGEADLFDNTENYLQKDIHKVDDFCLPETQELFAAKKQWNEKPEDMFQIDTQDFMLSSLKNTSKVLENSFHHKSEATPQIHHTPARYVNDELFDSDIEEEMSKLIWDESDKVNYKPNINENASITPELVLNNVGSAVQNDRSDPEHHDFTETQVFSVAVNARRMISHRKENEDGPPNSSKQIHLDQPTISRVNEVSVYNGNKATEENIPVKQETDRYEKDGSYLEPTQIFYLNDKNIEPSQVFNIQYIEEKKTPSSLWSNEYQDKDVQLNCKKRKQETVIKSKVDLGFIPRRRNYLWDTDIPEIASQLPNMQQTLEAQQIFFLNR